MKERCREVLEKTYLYLDGELLSVEERREIEVHLEECGPCYEHYGVDKEVVVILHRLRGKTLCPSELKARISRLLDDV
jgi:mycothiol system anti-sigma-R factor